jgi:hypothetical protein
MLKGGVIIYTCILARIFLKIPIQNHKIVGLVLTFIGMSLVGLSQLFYDKHIDQNDIGSTFLGLGML